MRSVNRKIALAAISLIGITAAGYLLSLGKEILVAANFGITKEMDAYYAAITIPALITGVLMSTFGAIFIPIFIEYSTQKKEEGQKVANIAVSYIVMFLLISVLVVFIFAPAIIALIFPGFEAEAAILTAKLLRVLALMIFFSGLSAVITGILNAYKHFALPAVSTVLITLCVIFFVLFFKEKLGIFTLAYGLLAGCLCQFIIMIPMLLKKGFVFKVNFNRSHPAIKRMVTLGALFLVATLVGRLDIVVDRLMASGLIAGSIAALGYADKLIQAPLQIFSRSIAIAAFPFFASQVAENKIEELKNSLAANIRMAGFILIPVTVILMVLSGPVIRLFFERGVFTPRDTQLTAVIFSCYAVQLFFRSAWMLLLRIFFALKEMAVVLKLTVIDVVLNIILNLIFMKIINPPAAGIALSTSVVCFILSIVTFLFLRKRLPEMHGKYIFKGVFKVIIASIGMGITVFIAFQSLKGLTVSPMVMGQMLRIGGAVISGAVVFIWCSFLLRIEELNKILILSGLKS